MNKFLQNFIIILANNKLITLPEFTTITVLPPALKGLVYLWEELSMSCLQAIDQQTVLPSPLTQPPPIKLNKRESNKSKEDKRSDKKSSKKSTPSAKVQPVVQDGSDLEKETICELCGLIYPHPVTYHMKLMHPGCGWHAGGNGYNSGGNYCVGWAGNCGDGGGGGSSWYLLCDTCRDKYLKVRWTFRCSF